MIVFLVVRTHSSLLWQNVTCWTIFSVVSVSDGASTEVFAGVGVDAYRDTSRVELLGCHAVLQWSASELTAC